MIVLVDLSGIQDYLFQVRELGGHQARSLRFRSLFVQLVSEAIRIRLVRAAHLDESRIVFNAAGKFAIDGSGLGLDAVERLHDEVRLIELWLHAATHARLRINTVVHDQPRETLVQQYIAANHELQRAKLRAWSNTAISATEWKPSELVASTLMEANVEAQRDAELGRKIVQTDTRFLVVEAAGQGDLDLAGLQARFVSDSPRDGDSVHVCDLGDFMRHVPTTNAEDGTKKPVEFVDLARAARGAQMLSVLKADADSLGTAIRHCLENASDLSALSTLSKKLDSFFTARLDQQLRHDSRWSQLYTVFSGGDDLLLVGPWNIVLDFANHLQREFVDVFRQEGLTISAGVAIIKPKFPIRLAVQQAEVLLEEAKSGEKNQCAAIGGLWKWSAHGEIIQTGKQLADWVDSGVIQRGWLHTLLELVLLRRSQTPQALPHGQALSAARLAYHVARNWPTSGPARQWIDDILREFDHYEHTSHVPTLHLPAIIRYAMLATRSEGDDA